MVNLNPEVTILPQKDEQAFKQLMALIENGALDCYAVKLYFALQARMRIVMGTEKEHQGRHRAE